MSGKAAVGVFIVAAKRTPFGSMGGKLSKLSPTDLCTASTIAALKQAKVDPKHIDNIFVGNVSQTAPDTPYLARHVGLRSGIPIETPAVSLNRLCGSGFEAIVQATKAIALPQRRPRPVIKTSPLLGVISFFMAESSDCRRRDWEGKGSARRCLPSSRRPEMVACRGACCAAMLRVGVVLACIAAHAASAFSIPAPMQARHCAPAMSLVGRNVLQISPNKFMFPAASLSRSSTTSLTRLRCSAENNAGTDQLPDKQGLVDRLKADAERAMRDALEAEERAKALKEAGQNGVLLQAARKYKIEKESERLRLEGAQRSAEAARLAKSAHDAERARGTSTLAQKLSEESRAAVAAAEEAAARADALERQAAAGDLSGGSGSGTLSAPPAAAAAPLAYEDVIVDIKNVRLIPISGSLTDIDKELAILDELKRHGRLRVWDSLDHHSFTQQGYQRASSLEQLVRVTGVEAEEVDAAFGVSSFKVLRLKNRVLGSMMIVAGAALLGAGSIEAAGGSSAAAVAFGYTVLVVNLLISFFGPKTNEFVAKRLFSSNWQGFRDRAIICEAGHLVMAWICGLPLQEYRREYVGYPLNDRPTGRTQIYSSRRGDPEVSARSRPLGLPTWVSLERETAAGTIFETVDVEPLRNGYTSKEIDSLSLVLMAGPVAEWMEFGDSTNGAPLYQQLDTCMLMSQISMGPDAMQGQARWGIIRAAMILRENRRRVAAVAAAMRREATLADIIATLESTPHG